MFYTLVTASVLLVPALAQVNIQEPTFEQCERTTITWSGGTGKSDICPAVHITDSAGPYTVYVYPEAYLDYSSYFENIGPVDGTSVEYLVNLPEGDKLRVNVRDNSGITVDDSAFIGPIEVGPGGSDACLETGPLGGGVSRPETGPPSIGSPSSISSGLGSPGAASTRASNSVALGSDVASATSASFNPTPSGATPSSALPSVGGGPSPSDDDPNGALASVGISTGMLAIGLLGMLGVHFV